MNIHQLLSENPYSALRALRHAATEAGKKIFPLADAERPGSTGGVLSVWFDESGDGDWTLGGNILIGKIGDREGRSRFDSAELYDHHAACKNTGMIRAILEGRKDDKGRAIFTSSQLADETPEDPFEKRYGGGILCCDGRVAISFSGLPWKWDEVMSVAVAYANVSIRQIEVLNIIEVSENEHLATYCGDHFRFAA